MLSLAKPCIDVGLFTNQLEPMLAFYQQECGLPFEEMLPIGSGIRQHRHGLRGSVLKLNHSRHPLPMNGQGGYSELLVTDPNGTTVQPRIDPDGNRVTMVPPGHLGVTQIAVRIAVADPRQHAQFWAKALNAAPLDLNGIAAARIADSVLIFDRAAHLSDARPYPAKGFCYITIQVTDVDAVHEAALQSGAAEGFPPKTLGSVARISFIRDPDGNWIELSQRASLTGSLGANQEHQLHSASRNLLAKTNPDFSTGE